MKPTLIYDAECRLCVFSKKMMARWDTQNRICFLPAMESIDAMRLVDAQDNVSSGVDAFRSLLPSLPMGNGIAFIFKLPGVLIVAEKIYRVIARNRIAWFGKCRCT